MDDRLTRGLAVASLLISGIAAYYAYEQAQTAKSVPFRATLYQLRTSALIDFVKSSGIVEAALSKAIDDAIFDAELRKGADADPLLGIREAAKASAPAADAYRQHTALVNAGLPLWSNASRVEIGRSLIAADKASDCFQQVGIHADARTDAYWKRLQRIFAEHCASVITDKDAYVKTIAAAETAMLQELARTQTTDVPPGLGNEVGWVNE